MLQVGGCAEAKGVERRTGPVHHVVLAPAGTAPHNQAFIHGPLQPFSSYLDCNVQCIWFAACGVRG